MTKKAIIVCTWDWYYYSHRRNISKMFLDAGYEVIVVTKIFSLRTEIESDGVQVIDVPFSRASLNPFRELGIIWRLRRIYAKEKPDIVYHVAFKPVLYGSLAAIWKSIPRRINAIAGMGQLFLSNNFRIRLIRRFVVFILWLLFKDRRNIVIAQNKVDQQILSKRLGLKPEQSHLVRGVGVDLNEFTTNQKTNLKTGSDALDGNSLNPIDSLPDQGLTPFSNSTIAASNSAPVITLVSRLIAEKGIHELIAAARILKSKKIPCRIWLVGDPDFDSPHHITVQQLRDWESEALIEWKGHTDSINAIYAQTDIAVLPSYSEGLPKSLLDACACGLPIVTTNVSGCEEVVTDNLNGLIVPVRDPVSLAAALEKLINEPHLREQFGRQSRCRAETEFSSEIIIDQIKSICRL